MKKYLGRDKRPLNIEVVRANRSFVYDKNGNEYIDFSTNWCGILGWNLPVVTRAIKNFKGPSYVDPNFQYDPWMKLAKLLVNIAPGKMAKAFRVTTGTEAVEMALQAAMNYTKRYKFISTGGYHGHSFAALSVGFSNYHDRFSNLIPCEAIEPPYDKEAAIKIENLLSKKDIAAYISEPIICNRGVIEPIQEYFDIVQKACKKYGTVFIIDEVASGFGRTGRMFASEYYNLNPDIVCLGKGLTGGNAVLAACLMNKELSKSMEYDFSYYSTFAWQPLNVEITLAYLNYFLKHKKEILEKANSLGKMFGERLSKIKAIKFRGKGLAVAVEFEKPIAEQVQKKCLENGLIVDCISLYTLTLFPSALMDSNTAKKGIYIFEKTLSS